MGLLKNLRSYIQSAGEFYPKIRLASFLIVGAVLIGVVGYMTLEDYTFAEAFYMTVITVSTVGFGEVHPLSDEGRIFTAVLIIGSIGIFAYAVATIASFLIEGQFRNLFKKLRVQQEIAKLKDHTIVCGFGRNGLQACEELYEHKQPFVVIENDHERIEKLMENHKDYLVLEGDATMDEVLISAGINCAKALITSLPKDAENVFVVLTAREINKELNIISRASDESSELKLRRAGANRVIMPEKIGGSHMAKMVMAPDIIDFFTMLSSHGGVSVNFEEIDLQKLGIAQIKNTINDLDIRRNTGANVIGLKKVNGEYLVNPAPDTSLEDVYSLILLGDEEQLTAFRKYLENITH